MVRFRFAMMFCKCSFLHESIPDAQFCDTRIRFLLHVLVILQFSILHIQHTTNVHPLKENLIIFDKPKTDGRDT